MKRGTEISPRRAVLAASLEQAAIDSDAIAKRMHAALLPMAVAATTPKVERAARLLADAARAMNGATTPALTLFFGPFDSEDDGAP